LSDSPVPQRGDIFWADLPNTDSVGSEQRDRRPVLVVSATKLNEALPQVCVIVPLTTNLNKANRNFRIRILEAAKVNEPGTSGCSGDSIALTEQVRCISRDRLDEKRIARAKPVAVAAVEAGLKFVLGLP
jgi:mRNA-degrading endonuclease toxin of MazEF toxin-antitoxin module